MAGRRQPCPVRAEGNLCQPAVVAGELGPAGWPQLVLIVLIAATVLSLAQSLYSLSLHRRTATTHSIQSEILGLSRQGIRRLFLAIVVSLLYLFLLTRIGFVLSTFLLMSGMMLLMKYPSVWRAGLIAALVVVALALLFGRLMFVPLPRGLWIFREISYLFY